MHQPVAWCAGRESRCVPLLKEHDMSLNHQHGYVEFNAASRRKLHGPSRPHTVVLPACRLAQ